MSIYSFRYLFILILCWKDNELYLVCMPLFLYSFLFYLPDQNQKERPHQKTKERKYYDLYFIKTEMYLVIWIILVINVLAFGWWVVRRLNPSRGRPKSKKQILAVSLVNARQKVWVSYVLVDDNFKGIPRVTSNVTRLRTLAVQWPWLPSIHEHLLPFIRSTFIYQIKNWISVYIKRQWNVNIMPSILLEKNIFGNQNHDK